MPARKPKTVQKRRKEALELLQKLVRLKAADDNGYCSCVSCGVVRQWDGAMQGGHFVAKGNGGKNMWALVEENVHPQCAGCNGFGMRFGNAETAYTLYMIDMYGREKVDEMMEKNITSKLNRIELEDLISDWKEQINDNLKRIGQKC